MNERFELTKTSLFYTHEPEDAIRVVEGSVYVYIVPWSEESTKAGKRVPLCEVEADHSIPAFAWRDMNYKHWRFLLIPKTEKVVLETMPGAATLILKRRFLANAGITTFEAEGFEASLAESIPAPVHAGDPLGTVQVLLDGKVIARIPAVAAQDVRLPGLLEGFYRLMENWR